MEESGNSPIYNDARVAAANSAIGFLKLGIAEGSQNALCAGSGTLVTLGKISGILTAAHVLENLSTNEEVGLLRFPIVGSRSQQMKIDMSYQRPHPIKRGPIESEGPDLAFLELSLPTVYSLEARGNVFFNLDKHLDRGVPTFALSSESYFDCVVGVINQWTKEAPTEPSAPRRIDFSASVEIGELVQTLCRDEFDFFEFKPHPHSEYRAPDTYGGVSGGGLWRFFYKAKSDDDLELTDKALLGVVFYQSKQIENTRTLVGHGPSSIYRELRSTVTSATA